MMSSCLSKCIRVLIALKLCKTLYGMIPNSKTFGRHNLNMGEFD